MKQIPCLKHDLSYLLFIKQDKNEAKYICEQCLLELNEQYIQFEWQKVIVINKALQSPEHLISKLGLSTSIQGFFNDLDKYDDKTMNSDLINFQTQFQQIENTLKAVYKELEQHAKGILNMKQKIRDELKKIIKFDQFQQFAVNLEQLGDSINQQAIEQNEKILHQYFQELTKNSCQELNQKLIDMLDRFKQERKDSYEEQYPQFKKVEDQFKSFILHQQSFAQHIKLKYCGQICTKYDGKLISYSQLQKIINMIQSKLNKNIRNFSQIYLGSRDGLSGQAFWNKVNDKSDLLMIFKSKSGNICGGFSPCKWQFNQGYLQDNTLSSFLFSQTQDQIYPLKEANKAQAIYSHQSYGPIFGGGHDIYIDVTFQGHSSNLGHSYQCDQYQNITNSTHLFGQATPNIAECEIYQVIFF